MGKRVDRVGEINYNNFGSKMEIIAHRKYNDIDVYFEEYNWIARNKGYRDFNNGEIKCPYEPRFLNVGYVGEGKYKCRNKEGKTKEFNQWYYMLQRVYYNNAIKRRLTYANCEVCEEWHNFQNFAQWYEENYYEIEGEKMCLDKDILVKGNKIYSPQTCIFVPNKINVLFVKSDKTRGNLPIGVSYHKSTNKFEVQCNVYGNSQYLGLYNNPFQAFEVYKNFKEKYIKEVADEYKDLIPIELYNAMYKWEVEIDD